MEIEKSVYEKLFYLENNHWWFRGRRRIITSMIKKFFPWEEKNKMLDIGCGTGSEIEYFSRFGQVIGIDSSEEAINLCLKRGLANKVVEAKAEELPFEKESFNMILCFDVLEHIEFPEIALSEINRVLENKGIAFITAPAFKFLWSDHDRVSGHFRRYNIKELKSILESQGFKIIKISYFNFFLFPLVFLLRKLKNFIKSENNDFSVPFKPINYLLELVFRSEKFFLKYLNFPFGVSIIAIIQKI